MILDKAKIQHRMIDAGFNAFVDLAKTADVSQTALFTAMGTERWQARTVNKLAATLGCSPLDLITVESGSARPAQCPYCQSADIDCQKGFCECRDCGKTWSV